VTYVKAFIHSWGLFLIPAIFSFILALDVGDENIRAMRCLYIICIMGGYWMFQILPLPVTSLIPIVAFPLAKIAGTNEVCSSYFNGTMFMFIGGLIMAIGLEEVGVQKRLALWILSTKWLRSYSWTVMGGFMFITALLSMFISNTATVATMIPLVSAYCEAKYAYGMNHKKRNLLLLSVAYAANIGGTGIITGSPPNLLVLTHLKGSSVAYLTWAFFAIPLMFINLLAAFIWLLGYDLLSSSVTWNIFSPDFNKIQVYNQTNKQISEETQNENNDEIATEEDLHGSKASIGTANTTISESVNCDVMPENKKSVDKSMTSFKEETIADDRLIKFIREEQSIMGRFSLREGLMVVSFTLLVLAWLFRDPKLFDGWGQYLDGVTNDGSKVKVTSATPAIAFAILIFYLPQKFNFWPFVKSLGNVKSSGGLVDWNRVEQKMPWGVLLLLAGGFAMSKGCNNSGLSTWMAEQLRYMAIFEAWQINLMISIVAAIVTEFVSNTATANILVPILRELSISLCRNPIHLVMTTVISCSYAFMLPVATAPNALVFQASTMKGQTMIMIGFLMNIVCVTFTNVWIHFTGEYFFNEDFDGIPDWVSPGQNYNSTCN